MLAVWFSVQPQLSLRVLSSPAAHACEHVAFNTLLFRPDLELLRNAVQVIGNILRLPTSSSSIAGATSGSTAARSAKSGPMPPEPDLNSLSLSLSVSLYVIFTCWYLYLYMHVSRLLLYIGVGALPFIIKCVHGP